jgi:hypothetical protein
MTRHMMATANAVLQLRTQFLRVLSRPVKTLNKPFESLRSTAEPRQGAFRRSYCYTLYYHLFTSIFCLSDHIAQVCEHFLHIGISEKRRVLHGVPSSQLRKLPFLEHMRNCVENASSVSGA